MEELHTRFPAFNLFPCKVKYTYDLIKSSGFQTLIYV